MGFRNLQEKLENSVTIIVLTFHCLNNLSSVILNFSRVLRPRKVNLKNITNSRPGLEFAKLFLDSLFLASVQIFLTVGQNNYGNKILYHFKTPPPSMPLLARERKVSFSPHKSHVEKFFFWKVCSQVTQYHHGTFVKTMLQNRLPKSRHQKSSKINVPLFLSKQPTTERLKARKS